MIGYGDAGKNDLWAMLLVTVTYFGEVDIQYWEWVMSFLYVVFIYILFTRRKVLMLGKHPEYRYYLWGLWAKLGGAVLFCLIYFYYYRGGDTIAYFYSGVAMRNLALEQPVEVLGQLFGDNSLHALAAYSDHTGRPLEYIFTDPRTFQVIRISAMLALFSFNSYLVSTLLIASLSFFGIWSAYRTFVSYFPELAGRLAVAFLFMPSAVFWGSAILKDTVTFSATCYWVHAVDEIFFKRRNHIGNLLGLLVSAYAIIAVKPYIFMVLFPASLLWLLYFRLVRLRNVLVKFVLLPIGFLSLLFLSLFVLDRMGGALGKFSLGNALQTIQVSQEDLSNADSYGAHSFDVGTISGNWSSVLRKFPMATNAALFRPYIWESGSFTMLISGLEDLWILCFTLVVLWRAGPRFTLRCIFGNPLLLMCTVFVLFFAFTVGITTPNFGALVRFRIPMVPFFISGLFIVNYLAKLDREARRRHRTLDLGQFRLGTAHLDLDRSNERGRPTGKRH